MPSTGRWKPIPRDFTTTRTWLSDSLMGTEEFLRGRCQGLCILRTPVVSVCVYLSNTSCTVLRWSLLSHWTPPTTSTVCSEFSSGRDLRRNRGSAEERGSSCVALRPTSCHLLMSCSRACLKVGLWLPSSQKRG